MALNFFRISPVAASTGKVDLWSDIDPVAHAKIVQGKGRGNSGG